MILCLSHTQDYYTIDIVQQRLRELGKETFRLDTDLFSHRLTLDYGSDGNGFSFRIRPENGPVIDSREVEAVWYRKLWGLQPPAELDPAYHPPFHQEYTTMRDIFFDALEGVPWMNPLHRDHHIGGDKALQLQLAAAAGLDIPLTLMSNDPEQVRDFFYTQCKEQMIAKLHGSLSRSMSGGGAFLPTTQVRADDLQRLDALPYCPMIFQELIPKAYELRVAYVDGEFFAGKISAAGSKTGQTDWRAANDIHSPWEAYKLPDDTARRIDRMMHRMGLLFGAIDIIRHTDGRYIFLEVNPQGEWGMLQRDLHYPIGETIAEKLTARIHSATAATL